MPVAPGRDLANLIETAALDQKLMQLGHDASKELDERLMRKMMLHLTRNAIDAMPDGGTLTITVRKQRGWVVISFADTGKGIAQAIQDRAVDPFFTTKTYGTGLGLTLVEKIITTHGGNFSLVQKPDGGMEARINLPEKTLCSFGI